MGMDGLLVLVGGGLGSLARYLVNVLAARLAGPSFPYGTLAVNLVGCLLIGMVFALGNERGVIAPSARLFLMTGFIGGLTTFSSYCLESANLARAGHVQAMVLNLLANNLGGAACVLGGLWLGRLL